MPVPASRVGARQSSESAPPTHELASRLGPSSARPLPQRAIGGAVELGHGGFHRFEICRPGAHRTDAIVAFIAQSAHRSDARNSTRQHLSSYLVFDIMDTPMPA